MTEILRQHLEKFEKRQPQPALTENEQTRQDNLLDELVTRLNLETEGQKNLDKGLKKLIYIKKEELRLADNYKKSEFARKN